MNRTLEQLEQEQRTTSHLVHRIKSLQTLIKATQGDNWQDAAQQALSMINTEAGRMAVTSCVAYLIQEELETLKTAGVDFEAHIFFPGVVFEGTSMRDREQGAPAGSVYFGHGSDVGVVRALNHMQAMNGYWKISDDGKLQMTISQDRRYQASKGVSGVIPNGAQVELVNKE